MRYIRPKKELTKEMVNELINEYNMIQKKESILTRSQRELVIKKINLLHKYGVVNLS